ncbi:hypothetical protein [Microbacterium sp. CPCC 204701]|uniref:hypothetical protein n=1 Tax=Microbacterium sp. CPCC 204701 TaxID=2493084 RepID=UPI000FDA351D|nr:hypothetical protein [Microbacterium sp. CPCC 204701]
MAISARTRTLLTWLPATVLAVVIGAVVIASLAIQESWWTQENPAASADQKASDGSSMLTDAGFDYVNVEGVVRVRVGEGGLSATELGLPVDGEKSADFRRPVRALIAVGDEVHALDDIASLTAVAEGDRLVALTLRPDVVRGWSGALDYLRALAPDFGWDASELDPLEGELGEFNRSGEGETFTASIGPSTGTAATVTGTLVFDRSSGATPVTITFEPAG